MEVLFLLIPISLAILALIVWALLWSIRSGQFDDLEGPAQRILMDEDEIVSRDGKPTSAEESSIGGSEEQSKS